MVRPRSEIYKHFTTLPDGRRKCNYCAEQEGSFYNMKTSTSSLWMHLEVQHGHIKSRETESEQEPLTPVQQEIVNEAFIDWIVTDLLPFKIADSSKFTKFLKLLNSNYTLPCRQTAQKMVIEKFCQYKELIKSTLQDAPGMISLTSDIWTSTASDSYCGITAHFVDGNWKL
jgi:BED zinc finger